MPLEKSVYLRNNEEPIVAQKRMEQEGSNVMDAIILAGVVAGFVIARKKIAVSRGISGQLKAVGRAGQVAETYEKYLVKRETAEGASWLKRWSSIGKKWGEELVKPLPLAQEQINIALQAYEARGLPIKKYLFPTAKELGIKGYGFWRSLTRGPLAAEMAPGAVIGIPGMKEITAGKFGGVTIAGTFRELGAQGQITRTVKGVRVGIAGALGEKIERGRLMMGDVRQAGVKSYIRARLPGEAPMLEEAKKFHYDKYLRKTYGPSFGLTGKRKGLSLSESTLQDYIEEGNRLSEAFPDIPGVLSPSDLFKSEGGAIKESLSKSIRELTKKEIIKLREPTGNALYKLYRTQVGIGVGETAARTGAGGPQKIERWLRDTIGAGTVHPLTERMLPAAARIYIPPNMSLTGFWPSKFGNLNPASYYMYPAGGGARRAALSITEGTMWGIPEEIFGIGVTARRSAITDFITKSFGAEVDSYMGYFVRGTLGRLGRTLGLGFGAYYGFKTVNYLARQATGGWGATDVAGKMYTSAREFQQNIIDQVGLSETARRTERAFPGTIKSPLSYGVRASAPLWMAWMGKKAAGAGGARTGLAMGLAFALITWGDITQSPEELHRIYTGEQDIPVRKGRYWPFGRTPMAGGKIQYWRPHWYPMMRSRYKHRGQLWESETEELAQGSPLSPILAPLLQGRLWDPYYWEKKHYYDRPYPITGELFEPTMPGAWLGNLTLGQLIKPQRLMHPESFGAPQPEEYGGRGMATGVAGKLGMEGLAPDPLLPGISPTSPLWRATQGLYSQSEMMGIRGFLLQTGIENLTGKPDFLPSGPILQSARRATGYERAYWDLSLGDPFGATEFFRRLLPHRRRQIEEYNPIRNLMPEWMPGSENYIDFKSGDPYTKIEMGEARLPGPGYESLHRLHSGVPDVYDAVDRFLILSDIAPYSNEYNQYKALASGMVRKDRYWSEIVKRHIRQRSKTQQEYDFLELEPPEEVTGPLRNISAAYRHAVAFTTHTASAMEVLPIAPVSKLFPYKTAASTYKAYRIYGSDFTSWGHPVRDFIAPWLRGMTGKGADILGMEYIPQEEAQRREYEDYFDKLKYAKYSKLTDLAEAQGNASLARKFKSIGKKTMTDLNVYGEWSNIYGAMPKRERSFFEAFVDAREEDRGEILDMVPEPMQKLYKAQWNLKDAGEGAARSYDVGKTTSRDMVDYFKHHHLPSPDWAGWHPDVDLKDVQLRTVRNEGMDIHKFNLWQSQERAMMRRPFVPMIEDIEAPTAGIDLSNLQNTLYNELENQGFTNSRIHVTRTPSITNSARMKFKVKRNRRKQYNTEMRALRYG